MIVLLVALLCGYGIYAIVEKSTSEVNLQTYASKADTVFKVRVYDTVLGSVYGAKNGYSNAKRNFKPLNIELNAADTTQLKRVYGIGSVFAKRIVEYRSRLGGFFNLEQLKEVKGVDSEKFEQIYRNFYIDTNRIIKINVNFASANQILQHPYVSKSMNKRLEKYFKSKDKKSKGGIFNLGELVDKDILLPKEAQKIAPYLTF